MRPRSTYIMILACAILLVVACSQQNTKETAPPSYSDYELMSYQNANYVNPVSEDELIAPGIYQDNRAQVSNLTLNSDGTFLFYVHQSDKSGYTGTYEVIDSELALFADTSDAYYFRISDEGNLTFEAEKSNLYTTCEDPKKGLMDGDIFEIQ